jgi:hypothetical protein
VAAGIILRIQYINTVFIVAVSLEKAVTAKEPPTASNFLAFALVENLCSREGLEVSYRDQPPGRSAESVGG